MIACSSLSRTPEEVVLTEGPGNDTTREAKPAAAATSARKGVSLHFSVEEHSRMRELLFAVLTEGNNKALPEETQGPGDTDALSEDSDTSDWSETSTTASYLDEEEFHDDDFSDEDVM